MPILRFALDLTWVRHKIVGGTETFVNNLIVGFIQTKADFQLILIVAKDNAYLFKKYLTDERITMENANIQSASVAKRIIWQNLHLSRFMLQRGIQLCLEPVYAKPLLGSRKVKWVTVIHDLEALHFPENHSRITNLWLRLSWYNTVHTSNHIISISDFVKNDIINRYHIDSNSITTIYNAIMPNANEKCPFQTIAEKYGIAEKEYYYTVSKLNPHKNLSTLVRVFGEIKKQQIKNIPCKLLISGVNGGMADQLHELMNEYGLTDKDLMFTGFVNDYVRNCLYAHAKAFLFPSIFEGFGMPPIEAMYYGTPVVTTLQASIPEVTQHLANYVKDPYSVKDWITTILHMENHVSLFDIEKYNPQRIASKYIKMLVSIKNSI